ncbi:NAD(P)/FAD-dependent oxidoreductase [Neolewinella agarilytica]|uniref:NAD(P)/FAD-dependent oxidoreductase n=1 Tax=Neolewinella agarilytica TaxID=478744 RepID=UPI002357E032|nr:FAD/NAD(P)-binding oxidoreductase [Neolewinella agarilytica]
MVDRTAHQTCLIIGASHAGVNAAFALRKQGWKGNIKLFDREPELPYHRPPLSKVFLSGDTGVEDSLLKGISSYESENIDLQTGRSVTEILPKDKIVRLSDGETCSYDQLLLATGASPLMPPIPGLKSSHKIFGLRTAADARGIRNAFFASSGKRVVVIGGGYIGLEAAASLRKLGGRVTVLEREERVLARVTSPEMSAFFTRLHTDKGVSIATGRDVTAIEIKGSELEVFCGDGSRYAADMLIVGVGVVVNTALAQMAGLKISNGIAVNARMQTSDPDIYAIGDCTSFFHPRYEKEIRLESVQNAVDQAKVAAANICGIPTEYASLPWFWSDQFEVKLQMCGLASGYDRLVVRREEGDDPHQHSCWYFSGDKLLAVDAVNHARAYMLGMKLLKEGKHPAPEKLEDLSLALHPRTVLA